TSFFFSSRRRHTRFSRDWSSDVCSSDLPILAALVLSGLEETLKRVLSDGYLVAYGVVLVVSILFMPRGLVGLFKRLTRRGGGTRSEERRVGKEGRGRWWGD